MAARKQFLHPTPPDPELEKLLMTARSREVSEDELREQRISYAYGNAPADAGQITKDSVRFASTHIRLKN